MATITVHFYTDPRIIHFIPPPPPTDRLFLLVFKIIMEIQILLDRIQYMATHQFYLGVGTLVCRKIIYI